MGMWSKWFGKETVEIRAEDNMEDLLLQAGLADAKLTKQDALNIPSLAAGVDLISDVIASLPVKLYRENDGQVEEIKDDRVALINDDTKDTLNGFDFKKAIVTDYLLEGAAYVYINRKRNKVESLHYVEKTVVSIMKNSDPIFKSYDISVYGKSYRDFEFLKVARKTTDGITGKGIIDENNKLLSVAYNTLVFENLLVKTGGNKKGFLKSANKLSTDAIQALKTAWQNLYSNNNTENVVVLNNGIDFAEASLSSVEMQLNENKLTNAKEISRILRIPNEKIDDDAIKNCILPLLTAIETAFNKDLLLPTEKAQSFYFAFDTKELTKGDIEKRFKAYEIAIKNGWMQLDEVRYLEDYAPFGLDFIKLGLQDVLYNPKTGAIYTPNTDKTGSINNPSAASSTVEGENLKGGEEDEN